MTFHYESVGTNGPSRVKSSRLIHLVSFVVALMALIGTFFLVPELWDGTVTAFATVGGFFTAYGVVFAIIETSRARAASEDVKAESEKTGRRVVALYSVKDISECQVFIRNALHDLDRNGWAATSTLTRIHELYVAEFHAAYLDHQSEQSSLIASLQSHAAVASGPLSKPARKRLKETLLKMQADVTAVASGKMSENQK